MNINELEKMTGITKQNIRFYEKNFLMAVCLVPLFVWSFRVK